MTSEKVPMACNVLHCTSSNEWLECVLANFDTFLMDHAAAEKKASGMAMSMVSHYPDRPELVSAMTDLAVEELTHFREVVRLIQARQLQLVADEKDRYVGQIRDKIRQGTDVYLLDRLISAAVIEARGAERFGLIAKAIKDPELQRFYQAIARSESRHYALFIDLAYLYFDRATVDARWQEFLSMEAEILSALPIRAALH
jgi:tRNA-(ms[2]io[6]A)-hydroxylase